jgi:hypothetical protein
MAEKWYCGRSKMCEIDNYVILSPNQETGSTISLIVVDNYLRSPIRSPTRTFEDSWKLTGYCLDTNCYVQGHDIQGREVKVYKCLYEEEE